MLNNYYYYKLITYSKTLQEKQRTYLKILQSNYNWKKLKKLWQKLGMYRNDLSVPFYLDEDENLHKQKITPIQKDLLKNLEKFFGNKNKFKLSVLINLAFLVIGKLINKKQFRFLYNIFLERFDHVSLHTGYCSCYQPFDDSFDKPDLSTLLEERYSLIKKFYSEGKLNSTTYNILKSQFTEIFTEFEFNKNTSIDNDNIKLLVLLNKPS